MLLVVPIRYYEGCVDLALTFGKADNPLLPALTRIPLMVLQIDAVTGITQEGSKIHLLEVLPIHFKLVVIKLDRFIINLCFPFDNFIGF